MAVTDDRFDPIRDAYDGAEISAEGCPVVPLGMRDGVFYFLSPLGELRRLRHRDFNGFGLVDLFCGDTDWLRKTFPKRDSDGHPTDELVAKTAAAWLIRQCAAAGLWDPKQPVRGPGVWRGADGGLVVHCGDAVLIGGTWNRAGLRRDGAVYPAAPAIAKPAPRLATAEDGRRLLETVRGWTFLEGGAHGMAPDLWLGWLGAALLGGAPEWRAHLLVVGPRGSGKTTLARLGEAALGAGAHPLTNNYTEAGIRHALTGEARAVLLDEAEHTERIQAVIELIRHMSGGDGAQVLRGDPTGQGQCYALTGCAYLTSILGVPLTAADTSRITVLRLGVLPLDPARAAAVLERINAVRATSPKFRARAIAGWARFRDTLAVWRRVLMEHGCDGRQADQLGTLLAGRDLLVSDEPPDRDTIAAELRRCEGLIERGQQDLEEDSEGQQCLSWLYTSPVDLWRSGGRGTVASCLLKALQAGGTDYRHEIQTLGLRLEGGRARQPPVLLVANRNVGLTRIFAGTRWADGARVEALRALHGAAAWPSRAYFCGDRQRCTAVPAPYLPVPEAGDGGAGQPVYSAEDLG